MTRLNTFAPLPVPQRRQLQPIGLSGVRSPTPLSAGVNPAGLIQFGALQGRRGRAPETVGEGISSAADSISALILGRAQIKRQGKRDEEVKADQRAMNVLATVDRDRQLTLQMLDIRSQFDATNAASMIDIGKELTANFAQTSKVHEKMEALENAPSIWLAKALSDVATNATGNAATAAGNLADIPGGPDRRQSQIAALAREGFTGALLATQKAAELPANVQMYEKAQESSALMKGQLIRSLAGNFAESPLVGGADDESRRAWLSQFTSSFPPRFISKNGLIPQSAIEALMRPTDKEFAGLAVGANSGGEPLHPTFSAATGGLALYIAAKNAANQLGVSALPVSERPPGAVITPEAEAAIRKTRLDFFDSRMEQLKIRVDNQQIDIVTKLRGMGLNPTVTATPGDLSRMIPLNVLEKALAPLREPATGFQAVMQEIGAAPIGQRGFIHVPTIGIEDAQTLQLFKKNVATLEAFQGFTANEITDGAVVGDDIDGLRSGAMASFNGEMVAAGKYAAAMAARAASVPGVADALTMAELRRLASDPEGQVVEEWARKTGFHDSAAQGFSTRIAYMNIVKVALEQNRPEILESFRLHMPVVYNNTVAGINPQGAYTGEEQQQIAADAERYLQAIKSGDVETAKGLQRTARNSLGANLFEAAANMINSPISPDEARLVNGVDPVNYTPEQQAVYDKYRGGISLSSTLSDAAKRGFRNQFPLLYDDVAKTRHTRELEMLEQMREQIVTRKQDLSGRKLPPMKPATMPPDAFFDQMNRLGDGIGGLTRASMERLVETTNGMVTPQAPEQAPSQAQILPGASPQEPQRPGGPEEGVGFRDDRRVRPDQQLRQGSPTSRTLP